MNRAIIILVAGTLLAGIVFLALEGVRERAASEALRRAALEAVEASERNAATKERITNEIENADADELRRRAAEWLHDEGTDGGDPAPILPSD